MNSFLVLHILSPLEIDIMEYAYNMSEIEDRRRGTEKATARVAETDCKTAAGALCSTDENADDGSSDSNVHTLHTLRDTSENLPIVR